MFRELAILVIVCKDHTIVVTTRMTVVFVECTKTMVFIHHVVHLQLRRPALPDALRLLRAVALDVIWTDKICQFMLLQRLIVTVAPSPQRSGNVETASSVVHIQIVRQCVPILINATEVILKTQALALCLFQRDAHDGLHRGGIAGTRVLHHIDMLNLVGAQTREFLHVLHPSAIDVNLGIASTQHLHATVALSLKRRNLRECIAHRSGLLQYRSSYGGAHGVALHMSLRHLTFYHYFL